MTLKEFTEKHIKADTTGTMTRWRRVFPTQLRFYEVVTKVRLLFSNATRMELQEKWERIHKGDVIETEWRPIDVEYTQFYY